MIYLIVGSKGHFHSNLEKFEMLNGISEKTNEIMKDTCAIRIRRH